MLDVEFLEDRTDILFLKVLLVFAWSLTRDRTDREGMGQSAFSHKLEWKMYSLYRYVA
jgi:hypothetical protein